MDGSSVGGGWDAECVVEMPAESRGCAEAGGRGDLLDGAVGDLEAP